VLDAVLEFFDGLLQRFITIGLFAGAFRGELIEVEDFALGEELGFVAVKFSGAGAGPPEKGDDYEKGGSG